MKATSNSYDILLRVKRGYNFDLNIFVNNGGILVLRLKNDGNKQKMVTKQNLNARKMFSLVDDRHKKRSFLIRSSHDSIQNQKEAKLLNSHKVTFFFFFYQNSSYFIHCVSPLYIGIGIGGNIDQKLQLLHDY